MGDILSHWASIQSQNSGRLKQEDFKFEPNLDNLTDLARLYSTENY